MALRLSLRQLICQKRQVIRYEENGDRGGLAGEEFCIVEVHYLPGGLLQKKRKRRNESLTTGITQWTTF